MNDNIFLRNSIIDYISANDNTVQDVEKYIFGRYNGLRLTYRGCQLLSLYFENYKFNFQKDFIMTPDKILKLNKLGKPFYYDKNLIVLFGQEDYVSLSLVSDVDLWINSI